MLYLTFSEPEHLDRSPGLYFDNRYSPEWFNDPVVQDIVQDVDGIKIVGPYLAIDPILGAIPPTQISNGAKALILALKMDRLIYGAVCEDHCLEWFNKIGQIKNVWVYVSYSMVVEGCIIAYCPDHEKFIITSDDFLNCYLQSLGYEN